jgi:hypothetical protein
MKHIFLKSIICLVPIGQLAYAEPLPAPELTNPAFLQHYADIVAIEHQLVQNGKIPKASSINNADKSKIEYLYGKWQVTYKLNVTQTDTIEIDTTYQDTDRGYYGWDSKHAISCFYEPDLLGTIYSYECLHITQTNADTAKTITQRYLFNINGNNLTGKYHSGNVNDFILALRANQLTDMTGFNPSSVAEVYFNDATGELVIPKITIQGKKYNATLKYEGGDVLRIKAVNPL